jgi:hypothetical protein
MNLHYKIVEVWPQDHLVVVRYWTDVLSEEFLASNDIRKEDGTPERCRSDVSITLPIPAPTDKELEDLLISFAPLDWLKTMEKIQAPEIDTSMEEILKIKGAVNTVDIASRENPFGDLTDDDIQSMIDKLSNEGK